ncbi:hypothetical protein TRVA0_030S00100 [Trichomonascus vanleenenianus]|uniref:uncharacterized protein n=1 Tax=Trichomonascus vanleenenianus TaxID=2268995 RepID=UPI003ECB40B3
MSRAKHQALSGSLVHALVAALRSHPAITKTARAYAIAYLYIIIPRVFSLLTRLAKGRITVRELFSKLLRALRRGLLPNRFPAFVAKLVASVYLLHPIASRITGNSRSGLFLASALSGFASFVSYKNGLKSHPLGADTSDMTLTLFVRAADVLARMAGRSLGVSQSVMELGDVALFTASCFAIMFAWFFYPEKLPPAYAKWITMAANMDDELVEALRLLKHGDIVYGERGPHDDILAKMCRKLGVDPKYGRFSESVPLPCWLVHNNISNNCEVHFLYRWCRGFLTALSIYAPINVAVALIGRNWRKAWKKILFSSTRSSAFLATFIVLNWYGVCLVRTRIGPKLFPSATPQQLEDTWGPGVGSALCGLSSLIENPQRRGELALFVAPRALSIAIPEKQHDTHKHIETVLFAMSFAVLATAARTSKGDIRGVFKRFMTAVF